MNDFEYAYPKEIKLGDGRRITLSDEERKDEEYFAIVVPPQKVEAVVDVLQEEGFTKASPAWNKGEAYGLSKVVDEPWEMHVRLYRDGSIYSHIEVRRDYFEHLDTRYIWPLIDEMIIYVRKVTEAFIIFHNRTKQLVRKIISKVRLKINHPTSRTEWKPVVVVVESVAIGAAIGLAVVGIVELIDYLTRKKEDD